MFVPPTVSEAQVIVPSPVILANTGWLAKFCTVIPVFTLRVTPELTVRNGVPVLLKVIELIVAFVVTVIMALPAITASSPAPGGVPPTHELPAFQSPPEAVEVTVAASALTKPTASNNETTVTLKTLRCC